MFERTKHGLYHICLLMVTYTALKRYYPWQLWSFNKILLMLLFKPNTNNIQRLKCAWDAFCIWEELLKKDKAIIFYLKLHSYHLRCVHTLEWIFSLKQSFVLLHSLHIRVILKCYKRIFLDRWCKKNKNKMFFVFCFAILFILEEVSIGLDLYPEDPFWTLLFMSSY